jgi:hypothetical protein
MRFMVLVKANKESEAGVLPTQAQIDRMMKFNDELIKAGVLLAGDGLQASSKGARLRIEPDKRTVIEGPFAETKELVAGYWIIQSKSLQEAVEWMKRCPSPNPDEPVCELEIRQIFEASDFA